MSYGNTLHTCVPEAYAGWIGSSTLPVPRRKFNYLALAALTSLCTFYANTLAVRNRAM